MPLSGIGEGLCCKTLSWSRVERALFRGSRASGIFLDIRVILFWDGDDCFGI